MKGGHVYDDFLPLEPRRQYLVYSQTSRDNFLQPDCPSHWVNSFSPQSFPETSDKSGVIVPLTLNHHDQ